MKKLFGGFYSYWTEKIRKNEPFRISRNQITKLCRRLANPVTQSICFAAVWPVHSPAPPEGQPIPSPLSAAPPTFPSLAAPGTHCAHHPARPPPARGEWKKAYGERGRAKGASVICQGLKLVATWCLKTNSWVFQMGAQMGFSEKKTKKNTKHGFEIRNCKHQCVCVWCLTAILYSISLS